MYRNIGNQKRTARRTACKGVGASMVKENNLQMAADNYIHTPSV